MRSERIPAALSPAIRAARLLALAIVVGWSLTNAWYRVTDWSLSDMDAYWNAALRLREGALLYPPLTDSSAADVYRYAPWFAWVWVPVTYLPKGLVSIVWSAILATASVAALRPVMQRTGAAVAVAFLVGSLLLWAASVGNVQPLVIAALVHGISRRSGPIWVGIAASLKAVPILYVLLYAGRREWRRVFATLAVAAVLTLPLLLTPLQYYPAGPGDSPGPLLALSPVIFGASVALLAALTIRLASQRSHYARLMSAGTVLAALPRISILDLSHLVVGVSRPRPMDSVPAQFKDDPAADGRDPA